MDERTSKNQGGFTLLEVMAAISILGLALAFAAPAFEKMIKNQEAGICRESRIRIQTVMQEDKALREDLGDASQKLLEHYAERYGQFCPAGGEYIWQEDEDASGMNKLFVRCSIHR